MRPNRYARRRVVAGTVAALAGLAGCSGIDGSSDGDTSGDATTPDATDPTQTNSTTRSELNLREANVVAVAVERREDGYRFDVTLIHDDDGEDGYANWWQIETLDGERLGRRELSHAHGTREFTRSATVSVPEGTTCVVVRGHDQTHGYGGQAMLVNAETGATTAVRQGNERASMADRSC